MTTEEGSERCNITHFVLKKGATPKECGQPTAVGRDKQNESSPRAWLRNVVLPTP